MKLNIDFTSNAGGTCLSNIIESVSNYMGRGSSLMYINSWKYYFSIVDFEKILAGKNNEEVKNAKVEDKEQVELLEQYHGVKVEWNEEKEFDTVKQIIIDELKEGRPIAINLDSYYCEWFKIRYKRVHLPHFSLVFGVDEEKEGFWVKDDQMKEDEYFLPFKNYELQFQSKSYIIITFKKKENIQKCDYIKLLKSSLERMVNKDKDIFKKIREFNNDLCKYIDEYEKWKNSYVKDLFLISHFRLKLFSSSVKYIYQKTGLNGLRQICDKLEESAVKWMSIYGMYCKIYFVNDGKSILKKLTSKIEDASRSDEEIYYELKAILSNNQEVAMSLQSSDVNNLSISEYKYIDLQNQFNNCAFFKIDSKDKTNTFSYAGRSFIEEGLPKNKVWEKAELKFRFPDINANINDNVSAMGQEIYVDNGIYKYIMILGAAEIGDHIDKIEICYTDDDIESVNVMIPNWRGNVSQEKGVVMWSGASICDAEKRQGISKISANIYGVVRQVNASKAIKMIRLPYCPNIHIFSITLAK